MLGDVAWIRSVRIQGHMMQVRGRDGVKIVMQDGAGIRPESCSRGIL